MNEEERRALKALRFDSAQGLKDVWRPPPFHVAELHSAAMERIVDGYADAEACVDSSPLGVVVQGAAGAGKTHLLGRTREFVQLNGGYFALIQLVDGVPFWEGTVEALRSGLQEYGSGQRRQLHEFLRRLAELIAVPSDVREILLGDRSGLTRRVLDLVVEALRRHDGVLGLRTQDTLRALVLLGSDDFAAQDVGQAHLQGGTAVEPDQRAAWGFRQPPKVPQEVVADISSLLALTGPTVIAIDQLDALFARSTRSLLDADTHEDGDVPAALGQIADGLLNLREATRRTLTVITCLPDIWVVIRKHTAGPVPDRFRETYTLDRIPSGDVARALVGKRFEARFREIGFQPPYPTWPIASEAFDAALVYTPRRLIKRVEAHVTACLTAGLVTELANLDDESADSSRQMAANSTHGSAAPLGDSAVLAEFDERFAGLRALADVSGAFDPKTEDKVLPGLLAAGLRSWIVESGVSSEEYRAIATTIARPAVHATLHRVLDAEYEIEQRWAFRGIASPNAIAAMSRIKSANTVAAPAAGEHARRLIVLRATAWPTGPRTKQVVEEFLGRGGEVRSVSDEDLRTFAALDDLLGEEDERLAMWLADRRPAMRTELLQDVLGEPAPGPAPFGGRPPDPAAPNTSDDGPGAAERTQPQAESTTSEDPNAEVILGEVMEYGAPFPVGLEALRKHVIIFAGSGSGKTVLVRRLIEECAIEGVSSIVLDPNNDLARLGDPWPSRPTAWAPRDAVRAEAYFAAAEVMIWTPGVTNGRPLVLPNLPDISAADEGSDEQRELVDEAISILAPRAKLGGTSVKAQIGEAVLRQALLHHARVAPEDCTSLTAFIGRLSRLPATALSTSIPNGQKIAGDLAGLLEAARTNDSLFGGSGAPLDPGELLTPGPGRRARVSVISLVGLAGEEQRQAFVNQLQIALFGWIKAHPVADRPLGGLYVMDEAQTFAPTSGKTPCTDSTNRLVAQARKYGLGLVFATQAPRNLQTKIANNCATQFLGALSGPANLDAARELAKSRGSAVGDLGMLETGRFYAAGPGEGFTKIRTPLCLSYHSSALTREEIILRASGVGRRPTDATDAGTDPSPPGDAARSEPDRPAPTDR